MQPEQSDPDSRRPASSAPRTSPDEQLVHEQEDAAAAEAARIGGRSGMEGMDEAERATAEHGGGEAEGFEQAEKVLERQATHADAAIDPLRHASRVEATEDAATYGEADMVDSTETDVDTEGTHPGESGS